MSDAQALIGVDQVARIKSHLDALYTEDEVEAMLGRLLVRLEEFARAHPELRDAPTAFPLDQTDVILITYGDQVREPDKAPLRSLDEFLTTHVHGFVSGVHILPFYPYTSDDGFSVVDYLAVDPALGEWRDIARIAGHFRLMADAVINHISVSSDWFQAFRAGDERYRDYFIVVAPATDLSAVTRPRALPLLTPVETDRGREYVWTTFSEDQIDLNFATPDVLLGMTGVLLEYVAHGAQLLRLDAIAYLWKQIGTACIHLPRTHQVVKFWRAVLDAVAPRTLLITETNVPHDENVSYFGDGSDEAQMIYQFSLPPLTLHALHTGDASSLQRWAAGLHTPSDRTTFFNFLASHDGIGVRPAEGILSPAELQGLVDLAEAHGGYVSYKS
ncbi:MAG TPA: alpha-amylase family glycosyl hydrolase, partial [Ardenticatenaceae bacterium]|nr:alpha-amylase family glycosyl hydrolase [Ardenticatenaceae bacterium]